MEMIEKTVLEQLHEKELEIVKEIASACKKMNINYYISFGTLLGAVRHQGFIPWDDDVDIWMKRDDYEIFLREGKKYLPDHLFIQHYSTERYADHMYIKVRDTNTLFLEKVNENLNINHGIFVDIFPLERINPSGAKWEYFKRCKFNLINGCYDLGYIDRMTNPVKKFIGKIIHNSITKLYDRNKYIKHEDERRKKKHRLGGSVFLVGFFTYCGTAEYSILDSIESYKFEDTFLDGAADGRKLLEQIYGNYMELPPVEERGAHNPVKIVFDLRKKVSEEKTDRGAR